GLDLTPEAAYADNVNAGTATASYSYAETANYLASSDSKTFAIGKAATETVVTIAEGVFTYNGSAHTPATVRVTGAGGLDLTPEAAYADNVNAGTATASYSYAETANYLASSDSKTFAIEKAPLTITAPSMSKYCGQVNPEDFECSVSGAVNGEVITTSYSFSGTTVIPASTDAKLSNYDVTYVNGVLTVDAVTVDASASSNPVKVGSLATLSAQVLPAVDGVRVNFYVNGGFKGSVITGANGVATYIMTETLPVEVYKVEAKVEGGCDEAVAYLPVYDPTDGFVTGGGWITSPKYIAYQYMQVAGKANFGFNAKYKKGKNEVEEVDGNTTFHLNAGNLDFKSSSHTKMSLVIAKHKATYTGEGTINGNGGYAFRVIAVDGHIKSNPSVDQFRIKIWEKHSGTVVYDNEYTSDENVEPGSAATALGGGSIVIHENKSVNGNSNGKKLEIADQLEGLSVARFDNYPNAFADRTTIRFAFDTDQNFALEVYDVRGSLIKKVATGKADAGQVYEYELDARNLAEGVYFARLITGSKAQTIKMILKK
ncbi:T9SS type A sorting domain-containing protein, partial [Pontibacter sp. HSC-14F20]|uniref:MBG domain-containing protein n=1 Tax=Pontibacter sp. HSC-14F20 TaxID=2864136 RepID=UPI001C739FCB